MNRRMFLKGSAISAGILLSGGVVFANTNEPDKKDRSKGCHDFKDNNKDGFCDNSSTCRKQCNKKPANTSGKNSQST